MSTRTEFNDEDLTPVLRRLIAEGRLRDYVLIELYATVPFSVERLVKIRVSELLMQSGTPDGLGIQFRGAVRRVHLDGDGLFAIRAWVKLAELEQADYLFPSLRSMHGHLCSRQARRIIDAQFHRTKEPGAPEGIAWQQELKKDFKCQLSRWPWVECARAHSGERCATHCEGVSVAGPRRPFRIRGVLKPRLGSERKLGGRED